MLLCTIFSPRVVWLRKVRNSQGDIGSKSAFAERHVTLHDFVFFRSQRAFLEQDGVGYPDLANIVQGAACSISSTVSGGSCQLAHQQSRILPDSNHMPPRLVVAVFGQTCEAVNYGVGGQAKCRLARP